MLILRQRDELRQVATRWLNQYRRDIEDPSRRTDGRGHHWAGIYNKLKALDPETCTAEEVNAIIGNKSWTRMTCDECSESVEQVLQLQVRAQGDSGDGDGHDFALCAKCVHKAFALWETRS